MSFLVTDALAQANSAVPPQASPFGSILMLVGFILIFYFMLWRPQSKRAKDQRELIANLSKGDEILTNGGLLGKISNITDNFIKLAVADGIEVTIQKPSVASLLPKGTIKSL